MRRSRKSEVLSRSKGLLRRFSISDLFCSDAILCVCERMISECCIHAPDFRHLTSYFLAMNIDEVIDLLKQKSNPAYLEGMKRFVIENTKALGIPIPELRKLFRIIKKYHSLALQIDKPVFTKPEPLLPCLMIRFPLQKNKFIIGLRILTHGAFATMFAAI